jgi:hypothetical protein
MYYNQAFKFIVDNCSYLCVFSQGLKNVLIWKLKISFRTHGVMDVLEIVGP